jgi:predicted Zn-dependent protease
VNKWRSLAPADGEADATYAAVALELYKISDARNAIGEFWRLPPAAPAPTTDASGQQQGVPGIVPPRSNKPGILRRKPDDPDTRLAELTALLLEQADASAVLAALSGAVDSQSASPEALSLLGELSLDAYDSQRAEHYAQQALEHSPKNFSAMRVLSRAYVIRGDAPKAISTAREAMSDDAQRGVFELADILSALDRVEEAHQELERLRSTSAPQSDIDRRLALLAFQAGDMKEAQQRFTELVARGEANDASMLYLADIAARDGDTEAAIAGYRRLYDSSVALSARSRAASLLLARKDRTEALTLLDDYAADHPESEMDLTLAKAHLLADHGEPDTGVELLNASLERHPRHPKLEYERAVILEQGGHVHESVDAMEKLMNERPDDPTLLNALGYTLADHGLELSRAESYIRRALVTMPDNPAALDSLGWVRFRAGNTKDALVMLERAYSIGHDSEIAAHWGEALWVSGDHPQARKVWAEALARDPDSPPLKATLARFIPDAAKSGSPAGAPKAGGSKPHW